MINVVPAFVVLYGLMQSFGNLGPGNSLGLVSAESYATAVRGTLYGFSACIGKVGAVVGTQTFTPIKNNLGQRWTFVSRTVSDGTSAFQPPLALQIIAAICGIVGLVVSFFFIRNECVCSLPLPLTLGSHADQPVLAVWAETSPRRTQGLPPTLRRRDGKVTLA